VKNDSRRTALFYEIEHKPVFASTMDTDWTGQCDEDLEHPPEHFDLFLKGNG
jgi:hypothetical protein